MTTAARDYDEAAAHRAFGGEPDISAPPDDGVPPLGEPRANGLMPVNGAAPTDEPREDPVAKTLRLVSLSEFVQRPSTSILVAGLVPAHSIVVVFGPPKGGKTFSVCDVAMHAALGLNWRGCRIHRPLRVAYLAGEGITGLRVRLKGWFEHHDKHAMPETFRLLPHWFSLPASVEEVIELLREFKPDIIVVDTLNAYFGPGDENATQDMTNFVTAVRRLREALACAVIVIHHTGHGDSGRERGSIALRAAADVLIQVAKAEQQSGGATGSLIGLQVIAARDIETMEAPIALRLVHHQTEWLDEDRQPLSTCIVRSANELVTLPGRGQRPLGDAQAAVFGIIQEMSEDKTPTTDDGEVLIARHAVTGVAQQRGVDRRRVSAAFTSLARRNLIRLIEPGTVTLRRTNP